MLSYYITLRLKQFLRFFSFNGMHPAIGLPISTCIFVFISAMVYYKAPYAEWVYLLMAVGSVTELQNVKTNSFLQQMVERKTLFRIKLAENLLVLIPLVVVMCYYHSWWQLAIAILFTILYSNWNKKLPRPKVRSLPVPFKGHAYEANFGFRTMFPAYLLYIVLLIVGSLVQNVYVLLVPFFLQVLFVQLSYGEVEGPQYIWMHRMSATTFLKKKFITLLSNYGIIFTPFLLFGLIAYTNEWPLLLLCFMAGLIAVTGGMLIKYQFYPAQFIIQITQLMFLGGALGGLAMPQLLAVCVVYIIYAAVKARKNIKTILKC